MELLISWKKNPIARSVCTLYIIYYCSYNGATLRRPQEVLRHSRTYKISACKPVAVEPKFNNFTGLNLIYIASRLKYNAIIIYLQFIIPVIFFLQKFYKSGGKCGDISIRG